MISFKLFQAGLILIVYRKNNERIKCCDWISFPSERNQSKMNVANEEFRRSCSYTSFVILSL